MVDVENDRRTFVIDDGTGTIEAVMPPAGLEGISTSDNSAIIAGLPRKGKGFPTKWQTLPRPRYLKVGVFSGFIALLPRIRQSLRVIKIARNVFAAIACFVSQKFGRAACFQHAVAFLYFRARHATLPLDLS